MTGLPKHYIRGSTLIFFSGVVALIILLLATRYEGKGLLDLTGSGIIWGSILLCALVTYKFAASAGERIVQHGNPLSLSVWILPVMLIIYLGSSAIGDVWFFPTQWRTSGMPLFSDPLEQGIIRTMLAMMLLIPFAQRFVDAKWFWGAMAIFSASYAAIKLYEATGFNMIYRVDSPSFVYRYWCFEKTFPRPGFYDPYWNAGLRIPFLVASGTWSIGVFLLPLLSWISPDQLYTPALVFFFLIIVPSFAWLSMAWIGAGHRARWIAAILALSSCQRFWVHLLHYGTAPALFSMSMALPIAALAYKYLYLEPRPRAATILSLIVCGLIMFCWPGSLIIALPFAIVALLHVRQLFPLKWIWLLAGGVFIALILLPLAMVPMRYSNLEAFTQTTATVDWHEHFVRGLGVLRHNLRGTNPLILVFGVAGVFFWPNRSARWFFGPLVLMLVLLSGWGEEFKKLLQSERMIIPAAFVAIVPAAWWLDRVCEIFIEHARVKSLSSVFPRVIVSLVAAVMLTGGYQAAKTWNGKGLAPFHAMPQHIKELISWISAHVPEDGRLMFAGKAVHGYGGAKIAALPMFTGREMMAADFYGFSPKLVEYQYPPRAFRYDGPEVLFEFMHLYNVTHVITYHKDWKNVFDRNPHHYRRVYQSGRIAIYETLRTSSMFLAGSGEVKAGFSRFDLSIDPEAGPAVIKYNWAEGLSSRQDGARVYAYDAGRGVKLIGIDPGTNRQVTITYRE